MPHEQPFDVAFEEVLDDGFATIEHVESIVWHGLRDRTDHAAMEALAAKIAASGTPVTPTLIAHDNLVRVAASDGAYLERPGTETLNPLMKRFEQGTYDFWAGQDPAAREGPRARFHLAATRALHEAGVPLVAGSDAGIFTNLPGAALTRELELLVKTGLTPHEALRTATANAAVAIGLPDRSRIAPGHPANLVLLPAGVLEDVSLAERPVGVMVRGTWLDREALDRLQASSAKVSETRTARRFVAMLLAN